VGAPTPFQHAAVSALAFPESYYIELQKKYLTSRNYMLETLNNKGFKPVVPKGSYYIMADVDKLFDAFHATDDFDFSRKLIERTRIATVPGFSFYSSSLKTTKKVRFAFCKKMETLEKVRELLLKNL
jgi:aminotransferase